VAETPPTSRPVPPGLAPYWDKPVSALATVEYPPLDVALRERHRFYSLALMAILRSHWNGNKFGPIGNYGGSRAKQAIGQMPDGNSVYEGGTYLGHNIAALAVDAEGRIIDFDFNHNDLFNSSVEHAESRLIRRVFSLTQIYDPWQARQRGPSEHARGYAPPHPSRTTFALAISAPPGLATRDVALSGYAHKGYSTLLTDVTVYTSLESCAQCSGIMCLGDVREVVFLQYDQGQWLVGNITYQATYDPKSKYRAPAPIPADVFDFPYYDRLNAAYSSFWAEAAQSPFFTGPGPVRNSRSITSFLCTDAARDIYQDAADELMNLTAASHPDYRRPSRDGQDIPTALTNAEVLTEVADFVQYATTEGSRGTPHRV
jgi:tRNA(Arg) A34 adenosine deaminase TadA